MRKIGLFGGTFDPIHNGHLKVAQGVMDKHSLDEIWFITANINPFKVGKEMSPFQDRLNMVNLAIEEFPQFIALAIEGERGGPSYTVDTLRQLTSQKKNIQFYLIISDETAKEFHKWKEPQEIIRLAKLIIATRHSSDDKPPAVDGDPTILEAIRSGWTPLPSTGISATEIRKRVREEEDFADWVPKKVLDYIYKNRLYLKH